MTRRLYVGVDGGGTKTHFTMIDRDHKIVAEQLGGTTYHLQIGVDGVERVLAEGLTALVSKAGSSFDDLAYVFLGLPAYGEDSAVDPMLARIPVKILGHSRYSCGNDMICGWAGSLDGADGINVVAGTGSIGYGERRGVGARAGGWSEVFSDEGSAYWLAVQGLNAFSRMSDGRLAKGPLYEIFRKHLGLHTDLDICRLVIGEAAMTRSDIAALSRLVTTAVAAQDIAARAILERAAVELASIADALRRSLGFANAETVPVSYSGGLFAEASFAELFALEVRRLSPAFDIRLPLFPPTYGAALYASKQAAKIAV